MAIMDKKALAAVKSKFDLHVLLVMEQEKCSKSHAITQAYHEGIEGVAKRLGAPVIPGTTK